MNKPIKDFIDKYFYITRVYEYNGLLDIESEYFSIERKEPEGTITMLFFYKWERMEKVQNSDEFKSFTTDRFESLDEAQYNLNEKVKDYLKGKIKYWSIPL
jgi:predicted S18 family serine protease